MPDDWRRRANCVGIDTDLFFPEVGEMAPEARAVCQGCAVREQCLEFALVNKEQFGIWGGTSENQRKRMRRHLKLAS